MKLYSGSRTNVRVNALESDEFSVSVAVLQGSALSPLLFIIEYESLSRDFKI